MARCPEIHLSPEHFRTGVLARWFQRWRPCSWGVPYLGGLAGEPLRALIVAIGSFWGSALRQSPIVGSRETLRETLGH